MSAALCPACGDYVPHARVLLGYSLCRTCGERQARQTRHTIVNLSKSNYVVVTDRELLKGLNKYAQT
jgi:ribosomal protein L37AE/L43A